MQDNIYAAPEANLVDTEAGPVDPAFYVVSPVKFFIFRRGTADASVVGNIFAGGVVSIFICFGRDSCCKHYA